jgi:hypothetical protein
MKRYTIPPVSTELMRAANEAIAKNQGKGDRLSQSSSP